MSVYRLMCVFVFNNLWKLVALALNGPPASGWWDWSRRSSRFLDRILSFQKKKLWKLVNME